nr:hypothetical protein [Tanacetum cinerariifolium]
MILAEPRSSCSLWLCAGYTSREATCGSSQLFIFPYFHRLMRGLDTCLDLNVYGVFPSVRFSYPLVFAFVLEMVGKLIYTVTSVLTHRDLDQQCATFGISAELRPKLPDRNTIIKDSPEGKISMYKRFIEFANYRIPFSKFLLCILEYYQINLSQLSVIGAVNVSHFEVMCCALGRIPTIGTFCRFYVNSISNGWLSFSKREGADNPCCYSKKFDSLKNWNNRIFWIDAFVCPLSTPWFNGTSVVKDPLPVDEVLDLPCVELSNENRTLIRMYLETFLCLVGLSRSFIETGVRPTLLYDNDE